MDHPHFVQHNDYRETFRLSEINDQTCKLLIVTDDGLEILRRALKCARKRQNWIDSEDADGYITPDDSDWDDISSTLDDLEYQLMCACEHVVLDDHAVIQIENGQQPTANIATGMALLAVGAGYGGNRIMCADGDKSVYVNVTAGVPVAELSTYNWSTAVAFDLILNANGGQVGIAKMPGYELDVNGAAAISGAFGCNSQSPQTAAALPGNASDLPTAISLLNAVVAALNANGITHQ